MDKILLNHSSVERDFRRNWWVRRKFLYYLKIIGLIWFDGDLPGYYQDEYKSVFYPGFKPDMFPGALLEIKKLGPDAMEYLANHMMPPLWLLANNKITLIEATEFDAYEYLFDILYD